MTAQDIEALLSRLDIDADGVLTVRGIRVVDKKGEERVSIGVDEDDGQAFVAVQAAGGDARVGLSAWPSLGGPYAEIEIIDGGNTVATFDRDGIVYDPAPMGPAAPLLHWPEVTR